MTVKGKQVKDANWTMPACFKDLRIFLIIFVVVSLLLGSVSLTVNDSMVIYAQKDKQDFMQVFFPIDGTYSEENSERSVLSGNPPDGIRFTLPRKSIDHVRIGPATEAADVVITKVELRQLFGTETYMPDDLVTLAKPIQMIDKLEVTPSGLLVCSSGNDPAFELQLNRPSFLFQLIKLFTVSVFLSITVFFCVTKLAGEKLRSQREKVCLLVIPLLVSLGIAMLFSPGFMSYDTLHALRGARNGVTDSIWPPMVSYVWRVVDLVSFNPSAMHFFQVFLLLFSIFFVLFHFTKKNVYATVFLLIYLSIPAVLGTLAVIWKDVLMAAFFVAGFAVIVSMKDVKNNWLFVFLSFLAVVTIFLGTCSRHNAFAGTVPLLFYLALVVSSRVLTKLKYVWCGVILLGVVLSCFVFVAKKQLDTYSFPGLVKMNNYTEIFIHTVRVRDVAGASLCAGKNLFGDVAPNLSLDEIRNGYDPRHVNLSRGMNIKAYVGAHKPIDKVWLSVLVHHPFCFFYNKFQLTKYLIGAHNGAQFIVTHPSVDKNEYGYSLSKSALRDSAIVYIYNFSKLPFFKPWFLYLISIASFVYLIRIGALTAEYLTIFLSAVFYFASLVGFGNAADARLPFYTTTTLAMFTFVAVFEFRKKRGK